MIIPKHALGPALMDSPFGRAFGHGGNNGDFECQWEYYADKEIGFIVMKSLHSDSD